MTPKSFDATRRNPLDSIIIEDEHKGFSTGAPEIKFTEIQLGKLLGKGSFGKVFYGVCRGQVVAVKMLTHTKEEWKEEKNLKKFRKEIALHQRLYHPNIVLLMGACTTSDHLLIVQELMKYDLEQVLFKKKNDKFLYSLSLAKRMSFAKDVALGMNWLHRLDPPVVHRDLKPSNCLLDAALTRVKIADFGLSNKLKEDGKLLDKKGPRGTASYICPEVFEGLSFTVKADVYAYGILLWQIMTRQYPYDDLNTMSFDSFGDMIIEDEERPSIGVDEQNHFPILTTLIEDCWKTDPDDRPYFEEVCEILTDALVETAIVYDEEGQRFWLKYFHDETNVKIDSFIKGMLKWFKLPRNPELYTEEFAAHMKALRLMLVELEDSNGKLTIEWFGKVLEWMGPFDEKFLKRIREVCAARWFHGNTDLKQANRLLQERPDGFFLVRFSKSTPGYFAISAVVNGRVQHQRVVHEPGESQVMWGHNKYKSLGKLVDNQKKTVLLQACPGSKYNFQEVRSAVWGYLSPDVQMI